MIQAERPESGREQFPLCQIRMLEPNYLYGTPEVLQGWLNSSEAAGYQQLKAEYPMDKVADHVRQVLECKHSPSVELFCLGVGNATLEHRLAVELAKQLPQALSQLTVHDLYPAHVEKIRGILQNDTFPVLGQSGEFGSFPVDRTNSESVLITAVAGWTMGNFIPPKLLEIVSWIKTHQRPGDMLLLDTGIKMGAQGENDSRVKKGDRGYDDLDLSWYTSIVHSYCAEKDISLKGYDLDFKTVVQDLHGKTLVVSDGKIQESCPDGYKIIAVVRLPNHELLGIQQYTRYSPQFFVKQIESMGFVKQAHEEVGGIYATFVFKVE